jgi:hypothetical protein
MKNNVKANKVGVVGVVDDSRVMLTHCLLGGFFLSYMTDRGKYYMQKYSGCNLEEATRRFKHYVKDLESASGVAHANK